MPNYTLELELFSSYVTDVPEFEIWADGVLLGSSYSVTSGGFSISVTPSYGGSLPSSLEFRFNDVSVEVPRTIEVRSVKINNQYVNTSNYLSSDSLTNGQASTVDIASVDTNDSDFIFDDSNPAGSEFTTGATQAFTSGNDTYRDYSGTTDQIFDMLGGRDVAYLGSGDDKVNGGAGNDIIRGGAGEDLIYGDADDDRIYGGDDDDTLYGGAGNDRLHGDGGNDEIHGGDGHDQLNGHAGNDVITGGIGDDKLNGGAGEDYLFGGDDNDQLVGAAGNDTVDGGDGDDIIYGGADDDVINGGTGDDVLVGNTGTDIINGDAGNDTIYLMTNDWTAGEVIYGGADTDELILSYASTIDFTAGVIDELETLTGSDGSQDVTYTIEQALQFATIDLNGGIDNSRVQITGTVDVTALGTPTVTDVENGFLTGSAAIDHLTISGHQLDALVFGTGTINFAGGNDTLILTSTSTAVNTLSDSSVLSLETIDASTAPSSITINLSAQSENFIVTGSSNADALSGGSGQDILSGGDGGDTINGGGNFDYIYGDTGNDTIFGEDGNDNLFGGDDDDIIIAGDGDDLVVGDSNTLDLNNVITYDAFQDGQSVGSFTQSENNVSFFGNNWKRIFVDYDITATTVIEFDFRAPVEADIQAIGFDNDTSQGNSSSQQFQLYGVQGYGNQTFNNYSGTDWVHYSIPVGTFYTGNFDYLTLFSDDDIGAQDSLTDFANIIIYDTDGTTVAGPADGDDTLTGGAGRDTIIGGGGDDTFNLANGDFEVGETIVGGDDTDEIIFTNATTVNFTTGVINTVEIVTGSSGDDNVTIDGVTLNQFTTIDFAAGANDVLQITSTSTGLNGLADGFITGLETISASTAAAAVTIDISNQSDGFTVVGSGLNDTLTGGTGLDILNGGVGDDIIYSSSVANSLTTILSSTAEANHIGGGWIVQTYTAVGTVMWTPNADVSEVYYLVVGGGGGGGGRHGGGGGAGGFVTNWGDTAYAVSATPHTITVGDGGSFTQDNPTQQSIGQNGQNSLFDIVTALGGGGGGSYTANNVDTGGSGGGGGGRSGTNGQAGLAAQTDSGGGTGYGNDGGIGSTGTAGAGGGGAGTAGSNAVSNNVGGGGGDGLQSDITGTNIYYAGGGGGGSQSGGPALGGLGGGGDGAVDGTSSGTDGVDGLGGGGGAARSQTTSITGSAGGSGTVVIRYQVDSSGEFSTLAGGEGNDTLYGSAGLDIFEFSHVGAANLDTVNNFLVGADQLDLSDLLTGYDSLTDSITDFIQITDSAGNSDVRVDTTGSSGFGGGTVVATIVGVTGLTDEATLVQDGTIIA